MAQIDSSNDILDFVTEDDKTFCVSCADISTWSITKVLNAIKEEQKLDPEISLTKYEFRCPLNNNEKNKDNNNNVIVGSLLLNSFETNTTLSEMNSKHQNMYNMTKIYLYKIYSLKIGIGGDENGKVEVEDDWGSDASTSVDSDDDDDEDEDDEDCKNTNDKHMKSKNKNKNISFELDVSDGWTILDIKHAIHKKESIPSEQQTMKYQGVHLIDTKTLKDYNIKEMKVPAVVLDVRTRAPKARAPNVDIEYMDKISHKKSKFRYYSVKPGLNYGGRCMDKKCGVYKQRVCMQKGLGTFSPLSESEFYEIVCPGCGTPFKCREFNIFQCHCVISYRKFDEKQIQKKEKTTTKNDVWRLGQKEDEFGLSDDATYSALRIECTKL